MRKSQNVSFKTALRKRAKTPCPVLRCLVLSCGVFSCVVLYFAIFSSLVLCLYCFVLHVFFLSWIWLILCCLVLSCVIVSALVLVLGVLTFVLILALLSLVSLFWGLYTQKTGKGRVLSWYWFIVFVFLSFLSCKIKYLVLPYGLLMPAPARHKKK